MFTWESISKIVFVAVLCAVVSKSEAQTGRYLIAGTPGISYYVGDLKDSRWPEGGYIHPSFGLSVGYRKNRILSFYFTYTWQRVSGADSLSETKAKRNFHFRSNISDFGLMTSVDIREVISKIWKSSYVKKQDWRPGFTGPTLYLGGGVLHMNPKGHAGGTWHKLRLLGTEGQLVEGGGYDPQYSTWQLNIKSGLGIGYQISRQFQVEVVGYYTLLFTDYLDDVGGAYPDYDELLETQRGELASFFTYGGRDGEDIEKGTLRANPDNRDGVVTMGIKCTYLFSFDEVRRLLGH